jgi:hypothetical protein
MQQVIQNRSSNYENLCVKWWNWLLGIPKPKNPANDVSGGNCARDQNNAAWFLCGTIDYNPVTRNCHVPTNKEIFFPLICQEISFLEYSNFNTESDLRMAASDGMDHVRNLKLTLDGQSVDRSKIERVQTSIFNVKLVDDNIFIPQGGHTEAVSDGYWVLLPGLESEEDVLDIHFQADAFFVGFTNDHIQKYTQDIKYHITPLTVDTK